MKLNKIIFTSKEGLANEIKVFFDLKLKKTDDLFQVYEWSREIYKDEENIVLAYFKDFKNALDYIEENYDIFKIAFVWFANPFWNTELLQWDIVIPNTFIGLDNTETFFIDYAVWEDYDLNNFWLVLSGICLTTKTSELEQTEFIADIIDYEIHDILKSFLNRSDYLEKIVIIKWIIEEELWDDSTWKNIVSVLDLVI